jgi:hypothetical protein
MSQIVWLTERQARAIHNQQLAFDLIVPIMLALAAGEMSEEQLSAWLQKSQ